MDPLKTGPMTSRFGILPLYNYIVVVTNMQKQIYGF